MQFKTDSFKMNKKQFNDQETMHKKSFESFSQFPFKLKEIKPIPNWNIFQADTERIQKKVFKLENTVNEIFL